MRSKSDDFLVRGHHKNLYLVELPQWLPREVVVKVTAEFEQILLDQIRIMHRRGKHAHSHSVDSLGGISHDSSDGEEDTNFQTDTKRYEYLPISDRLKSKLPTVKI